VGRRHLCVRQFRPTILSQFNPISLQRDDHVVSAPLTHSRRTNPRRYSTRGSADRRHRPLPILSSFVESNLPLLPGICALLQSAFNSRKTRSPKCRTSPGQVQKLPNLSIRARDAWNSRLKLRRCDFVRPCPALSFSIDWSIAHLAALGPRPLAFQLLLIRGGRTIGRL
jgi:hypothetical protein